MKLKTILFFITFLALILLLNGTAAAFSGGAGTDADPYHIQTIQDLKDVNTDLTASYLLMKNLTIDEGTWLTLGRDDSAHRFTGVFNGNGYTITFSTDTEFISDDATGYGLFGAVTDGAELKNIKIVVNGNLTTDPDSSAHDRFGVLSGIVENSSKIANCSVVINDGFSMRGNTYVGGLAGVFEDSTIDSSFFAGDVSGTDNVGGLAGFSINGSIDSSYAAGNVTGTGNPVGGLIGRLESGTVYSCYVSGNVTGGGNVGGLVGYVYNSTLSETYMTGTVDGNGSTGGLVGDLTSGGSSLIKNGYSAALVTGNKTGGNDGVGGIIGVGTDDFESCFYIEANVAGSTNTKGTAVTDLELKDISTFENAGWSISLSPDSGYIWYINNGKASPKFFWQYEAPPKENGGGSGFGNATVVTPPDNGTDSGNNSMGGDNNSSGVPPVLPEEPGNEGGDQGDVLHSWQLWLLLILGFIVLICLIGYIIVKRRNEE